MENQEKILHQKFVQYGTNAKLWMRKCILLLPEIEKRLIWRKKGFGSIYEYAAKLAGMGHDQVNEALRVLAKIEDKPELQKIVELKGINSVKPIITIATKETAAFWAEKVQLMSKNTLETYVREFRKVHFFDGLPGKEFQAGEENGINVKSLGGEWRKQSVQVSRLQSIIMELAPEIANQLEKLKGNGDWNDLMKQLLAEREAGFAAKKPQAVEAKSRHIPAKIKKFVVARTNGTCAFPGCIKRHNIYTTPKDLRWKKFMILCGLKRFASRTNELHIWV